MLRRCTSARLKLFACLLEPSSTLSIYRPCRCRAQERHIFPVHSCCSSPFFHQQHGTRSFSPQSNPGNRDAEVWSFCREPAKAKSIGKLAAASRSCGNRDRELQSHRNDFSVTFSHESSCTVLIGFRIRINRIGSAGCCYCSSRGEGCQRW